MGWSHGCEGLSPWIPGSAGSFHCTFDKCDFCHGHSDRQGGNKQVQAWARQCQEAWGPSSDTQP